MQEMKDPGAAYADLFGSGLVCPKMSSFQSKSGKRIATYSWNTSIEKKGLMILVHGFAEHLGRYYHVANFFLKEGFDVCGMDLASHGLSDGFEGFYGRLDIDELVTTWTEYITAEVIPLPGLHIQLLRTKTYYVKEVNFEQQHSYRQTETLRNTADLVLFGRTSLHLLSLYRWIDHSLGTWNHWQLGEASGRHILSAAHQARPISNDFRPICCLLGSCGSTMHCRQSTNVHVGGSGKNVLALCFASTEGSLLLLLLSWQFGQRFWGQSEGQIEPCKHLWPVWEVPKGFFGIAKAPVTAAEAQPMYCCPTLTMCCLSCGLCTCGTCCLIPGVNRDQVSHYEKFVAPGRLMQRFALVWLQTSIF